MLRPVSLLPALVAVATLAAVLLAPAAASGAAPGRAAAPTPLQVSIDNLTPSTIPKAGPIRVSGTVTNVDDQVWTSIALYAFMDDDGPMTTSKELAEAAAAPQDALVGARITTEGTYYEVDELAPGESAVYTIRVPRSEIERYLVGDGVYWFGVHALGTNDAGGDTFADGRARTFLPLVSRNNRSVDTALVIPIRRQILHASDGSIAALESWTRSLSPGGSLRSLVDLGVAAGSQSVTWLVDPAVVDAVRRLADGNPPRILAPTVTDGDEGDEESESASPTVSPTEGEGEQEEEPEVELSPEVTAAAEAAASWLERLHEGLEGSQILALPYGDTDVAAAAEHDPTAYRQARKRSTGDLQPWGLATTPAVSSPTGFLNVAGIDLTEPGATVLVTDRMFGTDNPPAVAHTAGRILGVTSSGAVRGGPGPGERRSPLAVRQRIVSEAAVRVLTKARKPLIVVLSSIWRPDPVNGFFDGLDPEWLNLTSVTSAMQRDGSPVPEEDLVYPETQVSLELDESSFTAATELAASGAALQNLLTQNDEVGAEVEDEALTGTSYSDRLRPEASRASSFRSRVWIETRLRSVRIDAPRGVILSSGSGRFATTVVNQLDEPVTVRIQAVADEPLEVEVPSEAIELGANQRVTVLLDASTSALGVRNVRLLLTDTEGVPLGSSDVLPIRSNRVSSVIWLILGTGVALLFGAILVRLFRRIRAAARA